MMVQEYGLPLRGRLLSGRVPSCIAGMADGHILAVPLYFVQTNSLEACRAVRRSEKHTGRPCNLECPQTHHAGQMTAEDVPSAADRSVRHETVWNQLHPPRNGSFMPKVCARYPDRQACSLDMHGRKWV